MGHLTYLSIRHIIYREDFGIYQFILNFESANNL